VLAGGVLVNVRMLAMNRRPIAPIRRDEQLASSGPMARWATSMPAVSMMSWLVAPRSKGTLESTGSRRFNKTRLVALTGVL
jgi:hypothetical protein